LEDVPDQFRRRLVVLAFVGRGGRSASRGGSLGAGGGGLSFLRRRLGALGAAAVGRLFFPLRGRGGWVGGLFRRRVVLRFPLGVRSRFRSFVSRWAHAGSITGLHGRIVLEGGVERGSPREARPVPQKTGGPRRDRIAARRRPTSKGHPAPLNRRSNQ